MGCKFCKFDWLDEEDDRRRKRRKRKPRRSKRRRRQQKRSHHEYQQREETNHVEKPSVSKPVDSELEMTPIDRTSENRPTTTYVNVREEFIHIEVSDPNAFNRIFIEQRRKAIDNNGYRSIAESWKPTSLQQLAKTIQSFAQGKSTVDRHWIIFYWIAHNIAYDTVAYFSKIYDDQSAESVFQRRRGVCAGYANLYRYLCDQLKMPCEIVSGYSKGYGFDDRESVPTETDHAWNAVEIDGHWYLMESTWGAGHINDRKVFQRELAPYYFLPQPNEMIYHHLPEEDKWQLLRKPIQKSQYIQMPNIRCKYFELNLEMTKPRNQSFVQLEQNKPYALVIIKVPNDAYLTASLKLNDQIIEGGHRIILDREKQQFYCYFAPSSVGKHKIEIYGKQGGTITGTYNIVLDLALDIKLMPNKPISYPKTWDIFTDYGLKILSPLRTHLIRLNNADKFVQILIKAPSDIQLLGQLKNLNEENVLYGARVYYDQGKDFWRCKFAPNANGTFDAIILAKRKSDPGNYTSAVSFKIIANQVTLPPFSFPQTWQRFYDLNLRILYPLGQGIIIFDEKTSYVEIRLKAPPDVCLMGNFCTKMNEKIPDGQQVYYNKQKDIWIGRFAPNQVGLFDANILAKKKSETGSYSSVVTFQIEANRVKSPPLTFPETFAAFYDYDLRIKSPRSTASVIWPQEASYAEVQIQAPEDIQFMGQIQYKNIQIQNGSLTQYNHEKNHWQLLFAPERTGRHEIIIFAKRLTDRNSTLNSVVKFHLDVTSLRKPIKFPSLYSQFQASKCQIYTPINGVLRKNSTILIHCLIPDAEAVQLTIDSQDILSKNYENSLLKQTITIGSDKVTIYAKYATDAHYTGLIQYSVE